MGSLFRSSALALVALGGCKNNPSVLDRDPVQLDGEWDEPQWNAAPLRGIFVDREGHRARPYSEVRMFELDGTTYIGLYAADENIQRQDKFFVQVGDIGLTVDAAGRVSDPRFRVGVDRDGTLDNPGDDDEEWVVELAVPTALVGTNPALHATRCDWTKSNHESCGGYSQSSNGSAQTPAWH